MNKIVKKKIKNNIKKSDVLKSLLEDPTLSSNKMAEKIGTYGRMIKRKKKELEDEHVIWGYTAVIDESKINHSLYVSLFKIKPLSKGFVDLLLKRMKVGVPCQEGVRPIIALYINGEYDIILIFSAPTHIIARKYYESLRIVFKDYFIEKPVLADVNFTILKDDKVNPEIERFYDFIP